MIHHLDSTSLSDSTARHFPELAMDDPLARCKIAGREGNRDRGRGNDRSGLLYAFWQVLSYGSIGQICLHKLSWEIKLPARRDKDCMMQQIDRLMQAACQAKSSDGHGPQKIEDKAAAIDTASVESSLVMQLGSASVCMSR